MFTPRHFVWIGLSLAFILMMSLFSQKKQLSLRTAGYIMTGICLTSECSKMMSNMLPSAGGGMHLDPLCLPFHLCSLMIFVVFYLTFGKEGKAKALLCNFLAVIGTIGSACALLIPTNGVDFCTPDAYQCFIYHAGLLWFSVYLIQSHHANLDSLKSLANNLLMLAAAAFLTIYINGALSAYDTNFFYLTRPPMENLPFLNLDQGWYVYFLRIISLAILAMVLFHLPFIRKAKKMK